MSAVTFSGTITLDMADVRAGEELLLHLRCAIVAEEWEINDTDPAIDPFGGRHLTIRVLAEED